jgi:hypothetical protein
MGRDFESRQAFFQIITNVMTGTYNVSNSLKQSRVSEIKLGKNRKYFCQGWSAHQDVHVFRMLNEEKTHVLTMKILNKFLHLEMEANR